MAHIRLLHVTYRHGAGEQQVLVLWFVYVWFRSLETATAWLSVRQYRTAKDKLSSDIDSSSSRPLLNIRPREAMENEGAARNGWGERGASRSVACCLLLKSDGNGRAAEAVAHFPLFLQAGFQVLINCNYSGLFSGGWLSNQQSHVGATAFCSPHNEAWSGKGPVTLCFLGLAVRNRFWQAVC